MKVLVIAMVLVIGTGATWPQATDDSVVPEMQWLKTADPISDLVRDLDAGTIHFIELTGQGPVLPGVEPIRRFMCYSQHAGTKVFEVGSCTISGPDDVELRDRAFKYAEVYNSRLVAYLNHSRLNDCSASVNWDAAWSAVNNWAGNLGPGSRGTAKLGRNEVRIYLNSFNAHEQAALKVCSILQKHGLDRSFTVEVSPRRNINTEREDEVVYKHVCEPSHEP